MAVLKQLPSLAIISGFKGVVDFYVHDGTPCARRWPASPGHRRALNVEQVWPSFTLASRLWSQLDEATQQAWNQTAAGTNLSGRDLCMKAYLSGYLNFETGL